MIGAVESIIVVSSWFAKRALIQMAFLTLAGILALACLLGFACSRYPGFSHFINNLG